MNPKQKISASEFNKLFTTLESVRRKHVAANGLSSAQKAALSRSYNTTVVNEKTKATPNGFQVLKDTLQNLDNSPYIASTFYSNIEIPHTKELIKASTMTIAENQVAGVAGLCANCSSWNSSWNSSDDGSWCSSDFGSNFGSNYSHNSGHDASWDSDFGFGCGFTDPNG